MGTSHAAGLGPGHAPVRLTRSGAVVDRSGAADLARAFVDRHCILFRGLLSGRLLDHVRDLVDRGPFDVLVHERIGPNRELCLRPGVATSLLQLLLNSEPLFRFLEEVTGCPPIGCFRGRVYRVMPGAGHHDAWHNDMIGGRLLALSLNLSRGPFQGGRLQIRERATGTMVHEVANEGEGDAIVFRLSDALQHRITDMEGSTAKTAFAGWFQSGPAFRALLGSEARA